ncbi:MAG: hypothetical protein H6Q14_793 [Bacteroidetes bacterium]|nr:hypothetical protein [Bacteroidota bacterium]
MSNDITLFTVLGWEQRFLLGTNHILENYKIHNVYLICFTDYLHMNNMNENFIAIEELMKEKSIELKIIKLEYEDSISNWKKLDVFFKDIDFDQVLINITTFPRETIWTFLFFLRTNGACISYIYYKPDSYDKSEGGLTKNHKSPRLLFKHSGVFDIDKKLVIFIITGFDHNRTNVLIEHYEPSKVVYLSQKGEQFENMKRNCGLCPKTGFENILIDNVAIDSYNIDESCKILKELIENHRDYNIIITSQGPKTSAISTYLAYLNNNNIALAYVPAREFSGEYSFGIGNRYIVGNIKI